MDPYHHVPLVIQNATKVVLALNHRYLWVDQYCIQQSNEDDVYNQMKNMDMIYSNAYFTVVAAAGSGSSFGLLGVGHKARIPQPHTQIGKRMLVSTLPNPRRVIKNSRWNTRCWVYQEAVFSKRRFIFTAHQVYFECDEGFGRVLHTCFLLT